MKKLLIILIVASTNLQAQEAQFPSYTGEEQDMYATYKSKINSTHYMEYYSHRSFGLSTINDCVSTQHELRYLQIGPLSIKVSDLCVSGSRSSRVMPKYNLSFNTISPNGKHIVALLNYKNPLLKAILSNEATEVTAKYLVQFTNCDGQTVSNAHDLRTRDIGDLINNFQEVNFRKYFKCEFIMTNGILDAVVRPHVGTSLDENREGAPHIKGVIFQKDKLITLEVAVGSKINSGYGSFSQFYSNTILLKPNNSISNTQLASTVQTAARNFIKILKNYGNVIIDSADLSETEKTRIIQTSVQANKNEILELLRVINENISGLDVIGKFEVIQSINEAYDYVKEIETRVGKLQDRSQRLNLGKLVQSDE